MGGYGLGVEVRQRDGLKVLEHDGGIEGFATYLSEVPERGITVVVLGNQNGEGPPKLAGMLVDVTLARWCCIMMGAIRWRESTESMLAFDD